MAIMLQIQPKASFILHNLVLFYATHYLLNPCIPTHIVQAHTQEPCDNLELKLSKLAIAKKQKINPPFILGPTT